MSRGIVAGVIAGAAGEFALNVLSYADMAIRARGASEMPARVVERLAEEADIPLAPLDQPERASHRQAAIGALLGYGMAVGTAVAYALLRRAGLRMPLPLAAIAIGGTAMATSDFVATFVGATSPRAWGVAGWASDVVPHAAYGLVTAATLDLIDPVG